MECSKCHSSYCASNHTPLILVNCGHSICESCASTLFKSNAIICPECFITSSVKSPKELPKNMALLSMSQEHLDIGKIGSLSERGISSTNTWNNCLIHKKELEAFCENEQTLLCIDCILSNIHKGHEISPKSLAAQKQRKKMQELWSKTQKIETSLSLLFSKISNFKTVLVVEEKERKDKISRICQEVVLAVKKREDCKLEEINAEFKKQVTALESSKDLIQQQLDFIRFFKNEMHLMEKEGDNEILKKVKERNQITAIATQEAPKMRLTHNFSEIKKENELSKIWKELTKTKKTDLSTSSIGNKRNHLRLNSLSKTSKSHLNFSKKYSTPTVSSSLKELKFPRKS